MASAGAGRFDSVLVPEAFADAFDSSAAGLPIGVFVIEYLAANTYRVRVIDTASGQLGLPLNLRDKSQTVDEVMTAVSRTAVFEPNNQLLFTLYQDASEGGENVGSFIHTLGLFDGVWCLDVPAKLGLADHPGALAVNPAGSRLYVASSIGGVAGYVVSDITDPGPEMPAARATAALGGDAFRAAIGASQDQVVVALDGRVVPSRSRHPRGQGCVHVGHGCRGIDRAGRRQPHRRRHRAHDDGVA